MTPQMKKDSHPLLKSLAKIASCIEKEPKLFESEHADPSMN
jgi:hypothetical protein